MKFGLFGGATRGGNSDDSTGYRQYMDMVVRAEELGYFGVFLTEHHFTGFGQVSATLNFLCYLAARTSRIRLGTAVIVLPWHNPMLLAEQAATLDVLSDGRLDLGIGRGYRYNEFKGFGIDMDEATERYDESLAIMKQAWTSQERFSLQTKHWKYEDAVLEPMPVQKPHPPLWVGASSPPSIVKAARVGMKLLLDQAGSFELTAERVRVYRETVEAEGRVHDPDDIGVTRSLILTLKKDEAWEAGLSRRAGMRDRLRDLAFAPNDPRLARPDLLPTGDLIYTDHRLATENSAIMGTPDECIERVKRLEAAGVSQVLFAPTSLDMLELFAREVMPAFASGDGDAQAAKAAAAGSTSGSRE